MKKCERCFGFGLWAMGDPVPMGRMDASEKLPTIPCPVCKANANPYKKPSEEEARKWEED
jgi:hypothetical protein